MKRHIAAATAPMAVLPVTAGASAPAAAKFGAVACADGDNQLTDVFLGILGD